MNILLAVSVLIIMAMDFNHVVTGRGYAHALDF